MTGAPTPERWAIDISLLLNAVLGKDRFPLDVPMLAKEYTAQKYPNDPVSLVIGRTLPGFDGALYRAPNGKKGWGIFYNSAISSAGRINFTLAHEFGHYLMHRLAYPDGIRCRQQDVVRWDSEYGQIEHQANVFSSNLLMPLDDFRRHLQRIRDATAEIVDDLSAHEDSLESIPELVLDDDKQAPLRQITEAEKLPALSSQELPAQWRTAKPVLCVPGLGQLDEAMALILAQLIERQGIGVRPESADALSMSRIFSLNTKDVTLVCLCYVANPTSAQVRYAIRRLRRKAPEAFILVSVMGGVDNASRSEELRACQADDVRQSLSETIDQIKRLARGVKGANDPSGDSLVSKAG